MKKPLYYPLQCIYFYPTESCNLKCKHCWIAPVFAETNSSTAYAAQNMENLSFDEIKAVIDDALPLGLNSVKLTGGEPFLHPQAIDYMRFFRSKGLSLNLETNGTLLDGPTIAELKALQCGTSISLDGATAEIHDRVRGVPGSFDKTMNALTLMKKNDYPCEVIFSLHKDTLPGLGKIIEFLDDLKGFSLKVNILCAMGRGKTLQEHAGGLDIETVLALNRTIANEYASRFRNVRINLHIPIAFLPARRILRQDSIGYCHILNIVGLLSDGRVSYCGIGRHEGSLLLGSVRTQKLSEIWTNSPKLAALRQCMPEALKGVCGICMHRDQCLGSCIAQTYTLTKDLFGAFAFCQAAYEKGLFPRSRIVRDKPAGPARL